jgi:hypothetical protein
MLYKVNVAVCSEIRTKHIGKHNVDIMLNFWMLNMVVSKVTATSLLRTYIQCFIYTSQFI